MKRLFCVILLLLPLTGCALFEDCVAFSEREWHKFTDDLGEPSNEPTQARTCSDPLLQTVEPPR